MKALLPVYGTHGDVLPFLAIGQELARRGHDVVANAPAPFALAAERSGMRFHPIGTKAEYDAMAGNPEFRKPLGGLKLWAELGLEIARSTAAWIEGEAARGDTVVVAPPHGYGARLAQDRFGLPTATLHVSPFLVESRIASPRLPGLPVPAFLPSRFRHWLSRGTDRYVLDRLVLPSLNAGRARDGLSPVRRLRHWWNSPDRMILAFPDWYAAPQLDWPLQAVQVGFPLADQLGDANGLSPELSAFLAQGDRPLVFIYSSWMRRAQGFFTTAVRVCERMGRRGILLCPTSDQVPRVLPSGVVHALYAPLSLVLPHCAALVHHGGVGTVAQALAAGVPQIVVPFMGDHFDEGERLSRIGAGAVLSRHTLTPGGLARALSRLLADPNTARACEVARVRIAREDGVAKACDVIERLADDRLAARTTQRLTPQRIPPGLSPAAQASA